MGGTQERIVGVTDQNIYMYKNVIMTLINNLYAKTLENKAINRDSKQQDLLYFWRVLIE